MDDIGDIAQTFFKFVASFLQPLNLYFRPKYVICNFRPAPHNQFCFPDLRIFHFLRYTIGWWIPT